MKMTMTATGDSILIQGYQEGGYPGFHEVRDYLAKGQARFGNLETCVTDWTCYGSAYCGGTWLNTEERVLDQIVNFGMNFLSFANNHAMDFGPDGLLQTCENVKKRGVALAGAGADLYEASKPVFRDLPAGRVAFIAVASSTSNDAARAGVASPSLKGRPGLNGLLFSSKLAVNREHFDALCRIAKETKMNGQADISRMTGFAAPLPEGVGDFGGMRIVLSEDGKEGMQTACNKRDLERVLNAIRDAKYIADYVVVMLHGHEVSGVNNDHPAAFHEEFAHACIDEGACAIIGTGTHQFKPIEIYNGKPIFYSLGNFCYQSNVLERQPQDVLEKYNFEPMSDVQALAKKNKDWTIGLHTQSKNFRTVIPYMEFEDGTMTHLELKPIDLGFDKPRTFKGVPCFADERVSEEIFGTLTELCGRYGTKLEKDGEVIRVVLP